MIFLGHLALASSLLLPAHSWYPSDCCSDRDCHPQPDDAVKAVVGGWLVKATGEIVPYSKTLSSPDGRVHRCWATYGVKTICLFVPPPGS